MLNTGTRKKKSKIEETDEEELDYEDTVDIPGESELVGDFLEESMSDDELEDGECELEEEEEISEMIQKCMERGDLNKLKSILKEKEDRCKKLQKEVLMEQSKEKKRREMQAILDRIEKIDRANSNLQRSLANSRDNTPDHGQVKIKTKKTTKAAEKRKQPDRRIVREKANDNARDKEQEKRSEYNDILSSFLRLKKWRKPTIL